MPGRGTVSWLSCWSTLPAKMAKGLLSVLLRRSRGTRRNGSCGRGEGLLPATLCAGVMMHMFIVVSCLCCIIFIVISLLLLYHVYCCINRNDDDPHSPQSQPYGNGKWFFSAPWRNYHLNQKVLPPE